MCDSTKEKKLSVTVITYNQKVYVGECLESIVSQRVSFPYEVVVGDDASTDGTTEVLRDFERRYPDIIRVVYRKNNIGHTANYVETTRECRGEYVAHVDGDDLMLPGKLQKQVEFLDANGGYSMVHHLVEFIDRDGRYAGRAKARKASRGDINVIARKNNIINSSVMFRRSALDEHFFAMPPELVLHDWLAHLIKAQYGKIGFMPEVLGRYRVYPESIIRSASERKLFKALVYTLASARDFKGIDQRAVDEGEAILFLDRARKYMRERRQFRKAGYWLFRAYRRKRLSYRLMRYVLENLLLKARADAKARNGSH